MRKKLYFENLDGLRFIAALVVFGYHLSIWLPFPAGSFAKFCKIIFSMDNAGGEAGVRFFFVLSGFLITYLMFEEQSERGNFSLLKFYLRRILRIWPLYFITLFIGFAIYPQITQFPDFREVANPLLYMTFLANFDNMAGRPQTGILGVQWSVSIEEQFYLVWPILFMLFYKYGRFLWVIVSMLIIGIIFNQQGGNSYLLLSCIQELSLGALAAWISFFYRSHLDDFLNLFSKKMIFFIYLLGAALILLGFQIKKNFTGIGELHTLSVSLFFVFVIIEQNYAVRSFFKVGSCKWLTYWGRRSYGLYLLHMIAITFSMQLTDSFVIQVLLSISSTFVLCEMSYRFIERPLLQLKEKMYSNEAVINR